MEIKLLSHIVSTTRMIIAGMIPSTMETTTAIGIAINAEKEVAGSEKRPHKNNTPNKPIAVIGIEPKTINDLAFVVSPQSSLCPIKNLTEERI